MKQLYKFAKLKKTDIGLAVVLSQWKLGKKHPFVAGTLRTSNFLVEIDFSGFSGSKISNLTAFHPSWSSNANTGSIWPMSRPETGFLDAKRRSQPRLTGSLCKFVVTASVSSMIDSLRVSSSTVSSARSTWSQFHQFFSSSGNWF